MPIFRHLLSLCCLFVSLNVIAVDPFNHSQRQPEKLIEGAKTQTTKCAFNEPSFASESPFNRLKLVGVILYKQSPKALFLDINQQLIVVKQGQRLGQERYLLQQIHKDSVHLQYSKSGRCEQTDQLDLRF
ncbi:pilus assembly protein PilP [Rodentibacter caecimuris]|uniref:pilus assembly protein PilP n=1 Tax=Rodentibacter caecimuris TaxID=1796644 RepID=UPI0013A0A183|nr:pilus assembly protein PilP [Rodentibacter heylii]QIA77199.1 hypothetical protein FEE42_07395 [Rodentibacter heylii]